MSNSIHFEQLFERFSRFLDRQFRPAGEGEGAWVRIRFGASHRSRRRALPFAKHSYGVPAHLVKTHRLGGRRRSSA